MSKKSLGKKRTQKKTKKMQKNAKRKKKQKKGLPSPSLRQQPHMTSGTASGFSINVVGGSDLPFSGPGRGGTQKKKGVAGLTFKIDPECRFGILGVKLPKKIAKSTAKKKLAFLGRPLTS